VIVERATARSADDLLALLERERVTVLNQTPSAFIELMRADAAHVGQRSLALRYIIFGGEALDFSRLRPWFAARGDAPTRLVNMYGITETTVHVTFRPVTAADAAAAKGSFIGQPIPGWSVHILDETLRPVPQGQTGELCVGGAGVARGYLNRPGLQAARFVQDPFSSDPEARLYRSGDLGREAPNGDIEYLGRGDHQVKIRGFRIELGEIESSLTRHDAVAQAVVIPREDLKFDKRLVAYWVPRVGAAATTADLRSHLETLLPPYMIPSAFVSLPRMPLTANGKLDRGALPAPGVARPDVGSAFVAPRTELEAELASIWSEVLGVEPVGVEDSFFELGGHSLSLARMAARLQTRFGVRVRLRDVFDRPTVTAVARLIAAHRGLAAEQTEESASDPAQAVDGPIPMSFAQSRLWFLEQLTGQTQAYVLREAWHLTGLIEVEALRRALDTIVARHAPLRTRLGLVEGVSAQTVGEPVPCEIGVHDLRALDPVERRAMAQQRVAKLVDRAFDLTTDVLLRADLVRLDEHEHILVITTHHIASDAWSQRILHRELAALYGAYRRDEPDPLPALPIEYATYSIDQRRALSADRLATLYDFWTAELADLPALDLPTDHVRPPAPSDSGDECTIHVPRELADALRRLGHSVNATLQMVLVGAYQALLSAYSGQVDFAVATLTAGRDRADLEELIGFFVNTLVLRADLSGDPTVRELVERVRKRSVDAYSHQDLPFELLVARLQPPRDLRQLPLVQVAFQLLQFDEGPLRLEALEVERFPLRARRARFDLEMTAIETEDGLQASIVFRADLFDVATVERFAENFLAVLHAFAANPDAPLSSLSWLSDIEQHRQLVEWSGNCVEPTPQVPVTQVLSFQVARRPEAIAVSFGDRRLTYGQLGKTAERLANTLRALGVTGRSRVAICLDRSVELVVAMVGVLEAGAAYVPLDPQYPADRLVFMMRDAGIEIVVGDARCPPAVTAAAARVVQVDMVGDEASPEAVDASEACAPAHTAYVMYTSGSTGRPKGVAVPHRAIARLVCDTDYVEFRPSDRVAFAASPSFDAATFEVWGALLNGAELVGVDRHTVLSPSELSRAITERGITVLFLTTALFHQIAAQAPAVFRPLRYLVVGGEAMDPSAGCAVLDAGPPCHLVNGYGPTENTTFSTAFDLVEATRPIDTVPIGRPIRHSTCYVLDDRRRLLPVGAVGELYVGGMGLADGYVNQSELTAERFVAHPFQPGERVYRTGDWARWRGDGTLLFVGRRDRQMKLHGYRIELGEIEHTLASHPAVRQCVVIASHDLPAPRLVAYWVGNDACQTTDDALRTHTRTSLPHYMVPSAFVRLASLPTTANGKIDVAALPDVAVASDVAISGDEEPRTALESALAATWAEVLNRSTVGVHENFFEIGGSSLLAISLAARIEDVCGRHVSAATLFTHPTIAQLAELCHSMPARTSPLGVVEIRRGGLKPPLYFPPGLLDEPAAISRIMAHLPDDQPLYSIQPRPATPSLEDLAAQYAADLVAAQPEGAFSLAGYSFSGVLAFEMARQLKAQGRDVRLLAIIDTGPRLTTPKAISDRIVSVGSFLRNVPRWMWANLRSVYRRETRAQLWRSVRKLARQLRGKIVGDTATPALTADEIFEIAGWPAEFIAQVNGNLRALANYQYRPYHGHLVLFRARTRPLFHSHERDCGWGPYALGGLSVVELAGDHLTITEEPYVDALGQGLREALETATSAPLRQGRSSTPRGLHRVAEPCDEGT
jgi:amino acid adenylation domain-containing protein